jgi:ABC-type sugar transport system permease subunit
VSSRVGTSGSPSSRRRARRAGRTIGQFAFIAPALFLVGVCIILPGVNALARSTTDWRPGRSSPFVGLDNFRDLFGSEEFRTVLGNQTFMLLGLPLWTLLPLAVAVLLSEGVRHAGAIRTVLFFPSLIPAAIGAIIFRALLAPDGLLNEGLRLVGLGFLSQSWLDDPNLVKPTLIAVIAWTQLGLGVMILSSALSAVPVELGEAARVDGANWWRRLYHVDLPSVRPVLLFWAFLQLIGIFLWLFGWTYVLTFGGPGASSRTLDLDIYLNSLRFGFFGRAAAEAAILLTIVVALVGVASGIARRMRRA